MSNEKNDIKEIEDIVKYEIIKKEDLSEEEFFNDLLNKCYDNKIIDSKFLEKIYFERLQTLQTLLKYYTKDESSSIMIEIAESVLNCINYTLGIYLKQLKTVEEIIERLKNESLDYMMEKGNIIIKANVEYSKSLLKRIQKNKLKLGNYSYDDTINYGISVFFKSYNDFFGAHESPGSIDYQLAIEVKDYVGVEYIRNYLERLNLENEFCCNFSEDNIKKLLYGYDKNYELLLINIFEIVLTNSLGLIICNGDIKALNISKYNREIIRDKLKDLTKEELKNLLLECVKECTEILEIKNNDLINYIEECVNKITYSIYEGIQLNSLENIFISFREDDDEIIKYIDKEKMSNKEFRKIIDEIEECSLLEEKIDIVNNKIQSLADLNDILDAECFFEGEYLEYFNTLNNMQIILLLKYIEEYDLKREWHEYFYEYLNKFDSEEKKNMSEIKKRIELL